MTTFKELERRMFDVKDSALKNLIAFDGNFTVVRDIAHAIISCYGLPMSFLGEPISFDWYNNLCHDDKAFFSDCLKYIFPDGIDYTGFTDGKWMQQRFDIMYNGWTIIERKEV